MTKFEWGSLDLYAWVYLPLKDGNIAVCLCLCFYLGAFRLLAQAVFRTKGIFGLDLVFRDLLKQFRVMPLFFLCKLCRTSLHPAPTGTVSTVVVLLHTLLRNSLPVLIPESLTSPGQPSDRQGECQYWLHLSIVLCSETSTPCIAIKQFDLRQNKKKKKKEMLVRQQLDHRESRFLSSVFIAWRNSTWKLGNLAQQLPSLQQQQRYPHSSLAHTY